MAIIAVLVIAFVTSYKFCGTGQNDAEIDSIKIEEYTAVLSNKIDWDSVAGVAFACILRPVFALAFWVTNASLDSWLSDCQYAFWLDSS